MRLLVLTLAVAFVIVLAVVTVVDVTTYGLHPLDVFSTVILGFVAVSIIGALRRRTPPAR